MREEKYNGEAEIVQRTMGFLMVSWDTIGFVHNKAPGFQFEHGFRVSEGE